MSVKKHNRVILVCQSCGTEYTRTTGKLKWSPSRFCSKKCQHPLSPRERFDRFVGEQTSTGCMEWQGCVYQYGYGAFQIRTGKTIAAHRAQYILTHGPIPRGMHILHSCDNRLCVNLEHLSLGTQKENNRDCAKKLRTNNNILMPDDVKYIRKNPLQMTQKALAERFGVSSSAVHLIVKEKNWRWLLPSISLSPE